MTTWPVEQNRSVYFVQGEQTVDAIAEEVPIAFVYNGVSHVVMMATPQDFNDFAVGFSLTEGIINSVTDIYSVEAQKNENGVLLQIEISSECFAKLKEKRRNLTGRTGCGLCGADSLESAIRWPEQVNNTTTVPHEVLEKTFSELTAKQPLHLKTGATHAAAWVDVTGHIKLVREDVGRHNALDKLIGAMNTAKESNNGFVALSSRISYEMVQKAAVMGIEIVAAVSAPTGLAIELAQKTNVTLVRCNKQRGVNIYTYPARIK